MELSTFKTSVFAKAYSSRIEQWDSDLNKMYDTLENLQNVQKNWVYLESIFAS